MGFKAGNQLSLLQWILTLTEISECQIHFIGFSFDGEISLQGVLVALLLFDTGRLKRHGGIFVHCQKIHPSEDDYPVWDTRINAFSVDLKGNTAHLQVVRIKRFFSFFCNSIECSKKKGMDIAPGITRKAIILAQKPKSRRSPGDRILGMRSTWARRRWLIHFSKTRFKILFKCHYGILDSPDTDVFFMSDQHG